jgi:integrase
MSLRIRLTHFQRTRSGLPNMVGYQWDAMTVYKKRGSPYYYYDFIFEGRRQQGSTHLTSKAAAERIESVKKADLAQRRVGIVPKTQIPLFSEFAQDFLETVKVERRKSTHRGYSISVRNLEPAFGKKHLDEIAPETIRAFKEARMGQNRSPATVNRDLACLRRILSVAVKDGVLSSSPFFGRRVEFLREHGRERILSFGEERKYLASADPVLKDVAVLILEMGLRPGEVFRLRRQDLHLGAATPYAHIADGKTVNAIRDVAVTQRALSVIKRRLRRAKGDYLFPCRVGNGYDWKRPMNELHPAHTRALRKSRIEPPFRIYDLRHTYGTRAIEAGVDPLSLAKLMGHADLKTTQRYVHLSRQHLDDAQKRIERFRADREAVEVEAARAAAKRAG